GIAKPRPRSPPRTGPRAAASRAWRLGRPSSRARVTATSNAAMTLVGIVVACGCHVRHLSAARHMVARLRYQPAHLGRPSLTAATARGPAATGATPIGPPRLLF